MKDKFTSPTTYPRQMKCTNWSHNSKIRISLNLYPNDRKGGRFSSYLPITCQLCSTNTAQTVERFRILIRKSSRIPLTWHPRQQTDAEQSNTPDSQTVSKFRIQQSENVHQSVMFINKKLGFLNLHDP